MTDEIEIISQDNYFSDNKFNSEVEREKPKLFKVLVTSADLPKVVYEILDELCEIYILPDPHDGIITASGIKINFDDSKESFEDTDNFEEFTNTEINLTDNKKYFDEELSITNNNDNQIQNKIDKEELKEDINNDVQDLKKRKLKKEFQKQISEESFVYDQFSNNLITHLKGMDAILIDNPHISITKGLLDQIDPSLKVVSTMTVGYDHLNLKELNSRKILVGNVSGSIVSDCVAEVAIGLALNIGHRLQESNLKIYENDWRIDEPQRYLGIELRGSTVGIVGLGNIGSAIAKKLKGFRVKTILFCGKRQNKKLSELLCAEHVQFEHLITKSDFIFICCPLTEETKNLFTCKEFKKMKSNSIIINVARGEIINSKDLYCSLCNNEIWGAGLDVVNPEPLDPCCPLLWNTDCFVSPHLGTWTKKTRHKMGVVAAKNIIAGLIGAPLISTAGERESRDDDEDEINEEVENIEENEIEEKIILN